MKGLLFSLVVLLALSAAPCLLGQTLGEITGRVSDASGASVPGAKITITNTATNAIRVAVSTDAGYYTFPSIAPGFYNVQTEHQGFKTANSKNVEVQVEQTVRLDFTLQVGEVAESINVSASAELLQAENVSLGTVIENQAVTDLPLNGREYLSLVALSSNVDTLSAAGKYSTSRMGGDRGAQSIAVAGSRIVFNYYTLDGVSNTDPDFVTYVVLPSIDAIQQFKVQTGVYPAEFGYETNQINVLTKSGGNNYHASLFEFVRNDAFDATPYAFTSNHPAKSPFKWNDYGFELDGPVRIPKVFDLRNRLFFMVNDEWKQQRQNSQSVYSVPTAAMFTGNISALGTTIYDPDTAAGGATKTPFPNNTIPTTRLDPISQKFLNYYASSNLPGLTNNYTQMISSPNNRQGFTLRMDFVESDKSQWTGRYSYGDENQSTTGISITGSKILTNYKEGMLSNTRTFSPSLVNETRFGYMSFFNSLGNLSAYTTDTVASLGIPGLQPYQPASWGVPQVEFTGDGFATIGDASDGPYAVNDNVLQVVDKLTWNHGKHTFAFGFEYNRQNFDQVGNQFSRGQFVFDPNATESSSLKQGDAFADFLLGDIYSGTVAVGLASANFQRNVLAGFVDDTWKVTSKLTLSLGLRYELTPPWTDLDNNLFNVAVPHIFDMANAPVAEQPYYVRQGNCSNPYAGPPALSINWPSTPAVCSNGMLPNQLMRTEYTDFAPRVGIAFSPDSKTVIRAGWGLFYDQDIGNAIFDLARTPAGRVTSNSSPGTPTTFWSNVVPFGNGGIAQVPPPTGYAAAVDNRTTYSTQYVLNAQRQLAGDWLVEAGYLGGQSHHLRGLQDVNQSVPGTVGSVASRAPWSDFGNEIQFIQDGGNGVYNSLSIKATRRFSRGLSVIGSYSWAHSIDTTSGIRNQNNDQLVPQDSYCLECERGNSAFDVRNRFVVSVLYALPVGKGKALNISNPLVNGVIGGWEAGGIITLQSGTPGDLTIGGVDNSSSGEGYDRPNATGLSPYLASPTPSRYYSLSAFTEAPPGQFGNDGRNTITSPGIFNCDLEVHKEFRMPHTENHVVQFRLEAFNGLNKPAWGMPALNILAGAAQPGMPATASHQGFGVVSSTLTNMRQVQLGLKYTF